MDTNKILASLSYFSIFFAPFLLPIILYFVSDDYFVKEHSKKALVSHLIPFLGILFIILGAVGDFTGGGLPIFSFLGVGLYGLLCFIVLIWNIVKGIKVLK
ncbi:DUF4870 domain-containing protein [Peribacillus deserti]|uniref:DUF4870 domain-containing protein n=1 Tax=Peribacillus deserti TaxID=673318 RepID=A0A2N5M3S0_9BACI|nr:DUF4870 domain-containing protein [Peribacillus deserti]PLT29010.1 hypothetical protein CUU66_15265 [Peribacillus deserti]